MASLESSIEKRHSVIVSQSSKRGRPFMMSQSPQAALSVEMFPMHSADCVKRMSYLAKDDPRYIEMRRANNEAVKRNRDKAKKQQEEKDRELKSLREIVHKLREELSEKNINIQKLKTEVDTLTSVIHSIASNKQACASNG